MKCEQRIEIICMLNDPIFHRQCYSMMFNEYIHQYTKTQKQRLRECNKKAEGQHILLCAGSVPDGKCFLHHALIESDKRHCDQQAGNELLKKIGSGMCIPIKEF